MGVTIVCETIELRGYLLGYWLGGYLSIFFCGCDKRKAI